MTKKQKSNSVTTHEVLHNGNIIFKVVGAGEFTFDRSKTSLEVRREAESQGWVKRIINMAAIERDPETGLSATPEFKFKRMLACAEHYMTGTTQWRLVASAPKADDTGLVLMGIMRALGLDLEAAEKKVAKLAAKNGADREATLRVLAKAPDVVAAIGQIKAERAAEQSKISAADMLADLMGDDEEDEGEGDEPGDADAPF